MNTEDRSRVQLHDIECTACGTRLIELTDAAMFAALVGHHCIPGAFLHALADEAPIDEQIRMRKSQWRRVS